MRRSDVAPSGIDQSGIKRIIFTDEGGFAAAGNIFPVAAAFTDGAVHAQNIAGIIQLPPVAGFAEQPLP